MSTTTLPVTAADAQTQRAERIKRTAVLVASIAADLAKVVDAHAEEIAEWRERRQETR